MLSQIWTSAEDFRDDCRSQNVGIASAAAVDTVRSDTNILEQATTGILTRDCVKALQQPLSPPPLLSGHLKRDLGLQRDYDLNNDCNEAMQALQVMLHAPKPLLLMLTIASICMTAVTTYLPELLKLRACCWQFLSNLTDSLTGVSIRDLLQKSSDQNSWVPVSLAKSAPVRVCPVSEDSIAYMWGRLPSQGFPSLKVAMKHVSRRERRTKIVQWLNLLEELAEREEIPDQYLFMFIDNAVAQSLDHRHVSEMEYSDTSSMNDVSKSDTAIINDGSTDKTDEPEVADLPPVRVAPGHEMKLFAPSVAGDGNFLQMIPQYESIIQSAAIGSLPTYPAREHSDGQSASVEEGSNMSLEDLNGEVLNQRPESDTARENTEQTDQISKRLNKRNDRRLSVERAIEGTSRKLDPETAAGMQANWKNLRSGKKQPETKAESPAHKPEPAHAYQLGNTVVVEDENGEVIKKYDLPMDHVSEDEFGKMVKKYEIPPAGATTKSNIGQGLFRQALYTAGSFVGLRKQDDLRTERWKGPISADGSEWPISPSAISPRRATTFVKEAPDGRRGVNEESVSDTNGNSFLNDRSSGRRGETKTGATPAARQKQSGGDDNFSQPSGRERPYVERMTTYDSVATPTEEIPTHDIRSALIRHGRGETAAEARRRRLATIRSNESGEQEQEDEQAESTAERRRRLNALGIEEAVDDHSLSASTESIAETPAERRRRLVATTAPYPKIQWGGKDDSHWWQRRLILTLGTKKFR